MFTLCFFVYLCASSTHLTYHDVTVQLKHRQHCAGCHNQTKTVKNERKITHSNSYAALILLVIFRVIFRSALTYSFVVKTQ